MFFGEDFDCQKDLSFHVVLSILIRSQRFVRRTLAPLFSTTEIGEEDIDTSLYFRIF